MARELFLDSGAFSAWRRGIELPLGDYIAFIKKYGHLFGAYVAMDVIPGSNEGRDGDSASKSYDNLRRMQDAGLRPIPVFHQYESYKWLEKMVEDGETYVGISPYLRAHQNKIVRFLEDSFSIVCDAKGRPLVKTHGFGMTSPVFMKRFPWYTVDSTSWNKYSGFGRVLVPIYVEGKPDFGRPPMVVAVTGSNSNHQLEGWSTSHPTLYGCVVKFLDECGVTVTEVRNHVGSRRLVNIRCFQGIETACQRGKLPFRIIYASMPAPALDKALTDCGVTQRLFSYFDLRSKQEGFIEDYLNTGAHGKIRQRPNWGSQQFWDRRRLAFERRATAVTEEGTVPSNNFLPLLPDGYW